MTTSVHILGLHLYKHSDGFIPISRGDKNLAYSRYVLGTERTPLLLLKSIALFRRLSKYDVVVTSEYFSSFGMNLRLYITRCKTKHITLGLNQSRKLLKTGVTLIDAALNKIIRRTDLIVVHSQREIELFSELHDIPRSKFYFSLWGFDLPRAEAKRFSRWPNKYVCLVGRNNRDIDTFVTAVTGMGIDGIIITSRAYRPPTALPANVFFFFDLPFEDTLDCIKNALANVILLKDNFRGAGHITAVAAMFAEVPQIVSEADVLKDYLIPEFSALTVPIGDAQAVRRSLERLVNDRAYAVKLSANAKRYAERWLTNACVSERIATALTALIRNDEVPGVDPEWFAEYEKLAGSAKF
jgi:glycosyltransferase involved in cell wall biosynthesis